MSMLSKWRGVVALALIWGLFGTAGASAHIVHPGNAYADIGLSPYKDEIVYASKLGLIASEESGDVFRPTDPLARADLAAWAAPFGGLENAGEGADAAGARQAALAAGLVDSLEGTATYADISRAIFAGALTLDSDAYPAGQEATRERYAAFVIANASALVDGKRLEERAGLAAGPAGIVKAQASREALFGYELAVGDRTWTLAHHPRVIHASGDPALWDGQSLTASWINAEGEMELLDFRPPAGETEAHASAGIGAEPTLGESHAAETHDHETHNHMSAAEPSMEAAAGANDAKSAEASVRSDNLASYWPILPAALVLVAAVVAAVNIRRRKSGAR